MKKVFVVDSVAGNANRYNAAQVIVVCEDTEKGPSHTEPRLVISGDLEILSEGGLTAIVPGMKLTISTE